MKEYIGIKKIQATPMTRGEHHGIAGPNDAMSKHSFEEEGYRVVYEDGYTSWSPKETFEKAYKEVLDFEFEDAEPLTYKDRVKKEADELFVKAKDLKKFIKSPLFSNLEFDERQRLEQQMMAMECYLTILAERIQKF